MEKVKKFLSKYGAAIVVGVVFILFLGFCALPMLDYSLVDSITDENDVTTVLHSLTVSRSVYDLFANTTMTMEGQSVAIPNIEIAVFGLLLILISMIPAVVAYVLELVFNKTKAKKALFGTSLVGVSVGTIIFLVLETTANSLYMPNIKDFVFEADGELSLEFNGIGSTFVFATLIILIGCLIREVLIETKFTTKEIVEFGVMIALAVILDKLPVFDLTVGAGSVNLSGIPLMILALRHGPLKGLFASSLIFGLLTCIIDGYGLQTLPFDYIIGFSGYALAGLAYNLFSKYVLTKDEKGIQVANIIIAFVIGGIGVFATRMIGGSISSYVLYGLRDAKDILIYNVSYAGPSAGFVTLACVVLAYPILLINRLFPVTKNEVKEEVLEQTEETK